MTRGQWAESLAVAAALVCALAPLPAETVEALFSTGVYPRIQNLLTPISNAFPFALFDLLVAAAVTGAAAIVVRGVRAARAARQPRPIVSALGHFAAAAAVAYLVFLGLWGFNYRRVPMGQRLLLAAGTPSADAVVELGLEAVKQINLLHAQAHASGWHGDEWRHASLRDAFARIQRTLTEAPLAEPGRLKATLFGPYFRWTSVDGMVDPFALEVLANPDLLPLERPFVAAHEWAHLAGFADESEANFVGWLTCIHADTASQYSGWLYLFWEISGEVSAADRARLAMALDSGPRRDVDAIVDRLRRGQLPLLRNASWRVYDQYLKANRVEEGIRSYGAVVTLILRARFSDGWTPVRRSPDRALARVR
jgi:hypothetical protein